MTRHPVRCGRRAFAIWVLAVLAAPAAPAAAQLAYPESRVVPVIDTVHGVALADPYRWLEDQQGAETRAWITAQNKFRERVMSGLPGRDAIAARLRGLLMVDVQGSPILRGSRYFFSKRAADQDLSAIYMREGLEGQDVVLVDPNTMAAEVPFSAGLWEVTQDGALLVYGIRRGGVDEVLLRLYDVARRRTLPFSLPKARYSGVNITPDNRALYFVRFTPGVGRRARPSLRRVRRSATGKATRCSGRAKRGPAC